jgi:two-component system sensor histidine kinase VicK
MTATSRADAPWRTAVLAIVGLLVAIAAIGAAGLIINRNIHLTVEDALAFDIELEDRGDDLRVAILEVRHYHRDLLLNNPDPTRVELWQERYRVLTEQIAAVEQILVDHPARASLPDVGALRAQATAYYDDFATAVRTQITNVEQFRDVATELLVPLESMESVAIAIDQAGEQRAAAAFADIDDATNTGTLVLVGVIVGLGAMGAVLGIAILRLVQDQRRLVAAEQAVVVRMAEAAQAKSNFIADASHELRTPLTVLRGNAEVGLAMQDECAHAEILTDIVAESARMSRLVDDLLFLARSDAANAPLELREVDAAELLDVVAARAEVLARERGARLEASVAASGTVRLDRARIEQAILVLVDNAAKYGPEGGVVELHARTSDDHLVVDVRDRGPGIPPEQQDRIFERFYRVGGAAGRAAGGSGLGLAIAAAIVEGHGGRVAAARRDGGGTVMTVTLPRRASGVGPIERTS